MASNAVRYIIEAKDGPDVVMRGSWDNYTNDIYPKIDDIPYSCEPIKRKLIYELILKKGEYKLQFYNKKKEGNMFTVTYLPFYDNFNRINAYVNSTPIKYKRQVRTDYCDIKNIKLELLDYKNVVCTDINDSNITRALVTFNFDAESMSYCVKDKRINAKIELYVTAGWIFESKTVLSFKNSFCINKVSDADCFVLTYEGTGTVSEPELDHLISTETFNEFKKIHEILIKIKSNQSSRAVTYQSRSPDYNSWYGRSDGGYEGYTQQQIPEFL